MDKWEGEITINDIPIKVTVYSNNDHWYGTGEMDVNLDIEQGEYETQIGKIVINLIRDFKSIEFSGCGAPKGALAEHMEK